ncbi:MAG TPA: PTS sugar transporter subunit IIA [Candidatus Paceibacterota bacterium]|nr:PTS sugar transporter subunit IIA [Verrucomicrobiota bacterium]HOX03588.1 PTS sugar transporter subunit IIA [Verrucomicrobiota bacterium]HRZ46532.1 PTS sugar transporter subunit IIA [Candidatus Paceibacterota bacterium]
MKLTVRDMSEMLGVSEKTVYRWIGEQKLPGYRVSGQYRFNRAEVLEWATANKLQVSTAALQETESYDLPLPALPDALQAGGIHYRVGGTDKESALHGVVEIVRLPEDVDREYLFQALIAREQLASTGIGDGIAVPHPRYPIVLHLNKPMASLCFLEKPVEYGALDGRPVHALFAVISPTVRGHLHLLSHISFALRDAEFRNLVIAQAGRDELTKCVGRICFEPHPPSGADLTESESP